MRRVLGNYHGRWMGVGERVTVAMRAGMEPRPYRGIARHFRGRVPSRSASIGWKDVGETAPLIIPMRPASRPRFKNPCRNGMGLLYYLVLLWGDDILLVVPCIMSIMCSIQSIMVYLT
jgi:hypothetical protein